MGGDILQQKMEMLRAHYRMQLATRVRELEMCAQQQAWTDSTREVLLRHAHQLAGMAATYGFAEISAAGKILEDALRAKPDAAPSDMRGVLDRLIRQCRQEANDVAPVDEEKDNIAALPLVLVVDDDPLVVKTLVKLLQDDARVLAAANVQDARAQLVHKPALMLLDHYLEGAVTGLQFLEELRAQPQWAQLPVVMLSADAALHTPLASDILRKPFSPESGLKIVRHYLLSSTA